MTALAVIGIIVLLIALLLNVKLRAEIKFYGGKLDFKVKYLFFTIFPFKEKKKKPKKESPPPKEKSAEKAEENYSGEEPYTITKAEADAKRKALKETEATEKIPEEKSREKLSEKIDKLTDLIEKVKIIWQSSKKGLKRLFKHIYIDGIVIDFVIAEGDAYDTAMRYGTVNAVTYNAINAVRFLFPVTVKTVDIACDFNGEKSRYDGEVKVTLRPAVIFSAVFSVLFGLLKNYSRLAGKKSSPKNSKTAVST
ncbi:MAG: DUF2953 domain-containing protein [Ruminococcus sp.]|nr:DUF2953 domain-containing protein [Ruminococcus sp.]MCM1382685.1 DUF2953 domain-containing protein [Muribaculaceae bacterium]